MFRYIARSGIVFFYFKKESFDIMGDECAYFDDSEVSIIGKIRKKAEASGKKLSDYSKKPDESVLVRNILKYLNSLDKCRARKVHGSVYSGGEPDIDCCLKGRAIKIEVKKPGEKVLNDGLQEKILHEWAKAGAVSFWVTSLEEVKERLIKEGLL